MSELPWGALPAFIAAAETGSLSSAARRLGVAQPTVRRQIEALERLIGASLFTRHPGGLDPTPEGAAMLEDARAMQAAARAMTRRLGQGTAGTVRITATRLDAAEVLPRILARVLPSHAGLTVEIDADDAPRDVLRRDADMALTQSEPKAGALVARKLRPREIGLFAARGGTVPKDFADLRLVGDDRSGRTEAALAKAGLSLPRTPIRTDDYAVQLATIRAGLAVGAVQSEIAERYGLRRIFPDLSVRLDSWIVCHEDLRRSPRVSVLWDAIVRVLG